MATNDRDCKFRNRIKKMLAEKIAGNSKTFFNNRMKITHNYNFEKPSTGIVEREETVTKIDEVSNVVTNNHTKNRKKTKLEKKKNQVNSKIDIELLDNDNEEIISKQNGPGRRRRIEIVKSLRKDCSIKKLKTNLQQKCLRKKKKSLPKTSLILTDELNFNNSDDLLSEDNNERNVTQTFSESKMKFGEPMIIAGMPKSISKSPLYGCSPVSKLNRITANSRGNILSNFFSNGENPLSTIFKNTPIIATSSHDNEIEKIDDVEENDIEICNENLENRDYDSDISFISNDDNSESNSCYNQTNNEFRPNLGPRNSLELGNDSKKKPEFYSLQNKVVAIMGPLCKFYFNGKLRMKVLIGRVEIYGFVFSKSETVVPAEIYSPRGSSLVSIETVNHDSDDETDCESLHSLLTHEGINKGVATDMENKLKELPDGQAVLVFENLETTLTKYLDFYYPFKLFPKTEDSTNYHNRHPKKAEKLLQAVFHYDDSGKQLKKDCYRELNIMKKSLIPLNPNEYQRILISGGKGVGKSTTLRYCVNSLLPSRREIVVLDFDPGQPEFTPPGCISLNIIDRPLTGPNFTHLKTPFHQIFIGDVNVAKCVPRYVEAVKKLVDYLNESPRLRGRTVIVNTMGFCTGLGWDIMVYIIKLVRPSTIMQIRSERSKNNFRNLLSSEVINGQTPTPFTGGESENSVWEVPCDHELHMVPSLAEGKGKFGDFWELEPRQQRDISLLAYLSKIPKEDEDDEEFLFSRLPRIDDTIPYSVPMSKLTISLIRTIVPPSHILATMNGNIVALCGIDETDEGPDSHMTTDFYPKTLLRAPISTCYGFGIVRGVDMENGNVFVNTPLSINELEYVNCLMGSIPLPTSLISSDRRNVPYIGEAADLPTSREPRRGYFRMRQRTNNA